MGLSSYKKADPEATPIKGSEVALKPTTKIIQGDWHWHGNRGVTDKLSIWHNFKGQNRYNMTFADGHVEMFLDRKNFSTGFISDPISIGSGGEKISPAA
ncbi:MAG TPA: hypothetical protein DCR17_16515 [Verrucomicrobiales bacterium]|nr:hypothetical protein [Verrucomicrobiae bacterium]RZO73673.1 MAG: hypothetical protein EVA71_01940 [Limisphaerales bacterium]HAO68275.1 hypothetical protein [Verrucomicrobiales bacterium]